MGQGTGGLSRASSGTDVACGLPGVSEESYLNVIYGEPETEGKNSTPSTKRSSFFFFSIKVMFFFFCVFTSKDKEVPRKTTIHP